MNCEVDLAVRVDNEVIANADNGVSITTVPTVPLPEGLIVNVAPALTPELKEMPLDIVT